MLTEAREVCKDRTKRLSIVMPTPVELRREHNFCTYVNREINSKIQVKLTLTSICVT